jgi:hypothetical protein
MNYRITRFHEGWVLLRVAQTRVLPLLLFGLIIVGWGCAKSVDGGSDGESRFLDSCDAECGKGYSCICGVCTKSCEDDKSCAELAPTAVCVEVKASKQCRSGEDDVFRVCDVTCTSSDDCSTLGEDYVCSAGFCRKGVDDASMDAGYTDFLEDADALVDAGVGSEWELVESNTVETLTRIWGFDDDDIWSLSVNSLLHYDGQSWAVAFENEQWYLKGLWGASPDDIWAVGSILEEGSSSSSPYIMHYDGIGWEQYEFGETAPIDGFIGIWGSAADNIYAFRSGSRDWPLPWHWDGSAWNEHDVEVVYTERADRYKDQAFHTHARAHGTSPDNIFVADFGALSHYDGTQWTILESEFNSCWSGAAWALSNGDFLVGKGGCGIYRYHDDVSSIELDVMDSFWGSTVSINEIWGFSDTDVFAVGTESRRAEDARDGSIIIGSHIWRYDGQSWTEEDLGDLAAGVGLLAFFGSPSGVLWVVGDEGTILRRRP